jgi:hypothetical protein
MRFGPAPTHCHQCGAEIVKPDLCSTGYGCGAPEPVESHPDAPALRKGESLERSPAICYACCGANDHARIIETGRATLYLVSRDVPATYGTGVSRQHFVVNWPGSQEFRTLYLPRVRKHAGGFGAQRTDAWFVGPDGFIWHAVNRGDNQIARCRRTKERAK